MDFYKQTNKELMKNNDLLQFAHDWAVELGIDPADTNSTNIKQKLSKTRKDILVYESKAKELGYSSLGNALKALSMITNRETGDYLSKLPEVFHKPPHSWIWGVTQDKKKNRAGTVGLGVREAERRHRMIIPLLSEAWDLAEANGLETGVYNIQREILVSYRTDSHKEFESSLYTYIHNLEPLTLEEEFEEVALPTPPLDPEVEALVQVMKTNAEASGQEVSLRLLESQAVAQINRNRRKRR